MGFFSGIMNSIMGSAPEIAAVAAAPATGGASLMPALIGGGAQLLGGYMANQAQANQASLANAFSAEQSQKVMDFQERMRATQYQTAVKDLMAAGLNPMLAYTQGGAGTPSGSAAVGQQAKVSNIAEGLSSSAYQLGMIRSDIDLKEANTIESIARTSREEEQAKNLDADTKLKILEAPNVSQRLKNLISEQMLNEARTTATNAEEAVKRVDEMIKRLGDVPEAESKGRYFKLAPYNPQALRDLSQAGASAASVARDVSNMFRPSLGKQPMPYRGR